MQQQKPACDRQMDGHTISKILSIFSQNVKELLNRIDH